MNDGAMAEYKAHTCDYRVTGCYIAWRLRNQSKLEWLSSNRTQKGQNTITRVAQVARCFLPDIIGSGEWACRANKCAGVPLALNFIASGECLRAPM